MPYSYPEIRTLRGLYLQPNTFTVPDGACENADNVVIRNDNMITSRRGYYTYFTPSNGNFLNKLFDFNNTLISAYANKLAYYTSTGTVPNLVGSETVLTGETVSISGVARSIQANKNLYITTDNGVLKLTNYNSTINFAGAPQALDIELSFLLNSSASWFTAGNQVSYRIVLGYIDANNNLILGAPSQYVSISNPLLTDISYTSAGSGPYTVTVTSANHGLNTGMFMVFSAGTSANANGIYQITFTGANTFTYSVSSGDPTTGTLSYGYSMPVLIETSIPSVITSGQTWFYQIYRSSQVPTTSNLFDDYRLLVQNNFTSIDLARGFAFATDTFSDILLGVYLYTNENSGEGENQANFQPPLAQDIAYFKNYAIYANCQSPQSINLSVIAANNLTPNDNISILVNTGTLKTARVYTATGTGPYTITVASTAHGLTTDDFITVSNGTSVNVEGTVSITVINANTFSYTENNGSAGANGTLDYIFANIHTYYASHGVANQTVYGTIANAGGNASIHYPNHQFLDTFYIYVSNLSAGTGIAEGFYYVVNASTDDFQISLTNGGSPIAYTAVGSCYFEGVLGLSSLPIFFLADSSITNSISVQLADTANYLVKAINRDATSLIYAFYDSAIDGVPGQMVFRAITFGNPIFLAANTVMAGMAFFPNLPDSFNGTTLVFSGNNAVANGIYVSKLDQPEAVPLVNFFAAGSANYGIVRIVALRDSLIIIALDGVFRLVGDDLTNFAVFPLDLTVVCLAASSVDLLNNQAIFLSNQGVCMVSESSVQIISRPKIENVIQPILGQPALSSQTSGMGYETERLYLLTTTQPNTTDASITYCYDILTNEWTTWGTLFAQGFVGPNDFMYYISLNNTIVIERKEQTKTDYSDQWYNVTIDTVSGTGEGATGTITIANYVPMRGDMILKEGVLTWIVGVPLLISGDTFAVVFDFGNNLEAGDDLIIYSAFSRTITWSPYHAGEVSLMKFFTQFTLSMRDDSMTAADIYFSGNVYGSSPAVQWVSGLIYQGWGLFPWGFEPWGQQNNTNLSNKTQAAPILRTIVPSYQARGTWIQPTITAWKAGEPLNLQSIMYTLRPYKERTTR